jgi:hypothetical protein
MNSSIFQGLNIIFRIIFNNGGGNEYDLEYKQFLPYLINSKYVNEEKAKQFCDFLNDIHKFIFNKGLICPYYTFRFKTHDLCREADEYYICVNQQLVTEEIFSKIGISFTLSPSAVTNIRTLNNYHVNHMKKIKEKNGDLFQQTNNIDYSISPPKKIIPEYIYRFYSDIYYLIN